MDLLVPHPDFHLLKAGRTAQSDGTKVLLREAKKLLAAYNEALAADAFVTLLDWAYFAVHNGDLDSRDNVGLRAIYDWTRDDVAFPALERWIETGHDPDLLGTWATTTRRRCRSARSCATARARSSRSAATRASS